ncbi:tetratricopeptide repeat protein [Domibacillus iocasae]|uniref:Tetratricopeptide repeat protein n=1 Tax=Domibacillus iocasae TaxID=1714016 RepID=A0A1E7DND0_9BACI|nr:hypothetical protein [Domibacillus iocasae]OES44564.1 hypothetical protein BA724_09845 [Domibacillus iocasae]
MSWIILYMMYLIIMIVVYRSLSRRVTEDYAGMLLYYFILSAAFPIVGLLASLLLEGLNKKRKTIDWFEEYENYMQQKVVNYADIRRQAAADENLIPFLSGLGLDKNKLQKQLIMELSELDITGQGFFLERAIRHHNTETAHYAAVSMNSLKDRFQKNIEMLRSQCRNESKPYLELITVYRSFLQSGFLNGSQKEELRKECKGFIDEAIALFPKETILLYYRGEQALHEQNYEDAAGYFQLLVKLNPASSSGYEGLIETFYEQGNWPAVYNMIRKASKHNIEFPYKFEQIIDRMGNNR